MQRLLAVTGVVLATAAATAPSASPSGNALPPTVQLMLQRDIELCAASAACAQVLTGALNRCVLDPVCGPALVSFFIANPTVLVTLATKVDRKSISVVLARLAVDPTLASIIRDNGGGRA